MSNNAGFYKLSEIESIDIDTPFDWLVAESIMNSDWEFVDKKISRINLDSKESELYQEFSKELNQDMK